MITLSPHEVTLLRTLDLPDQLHARLANVGPQGAVLDVAEADLLLELVTNRLMTHGFDAEYKPTQEGEALEKLVDRLGAEADDVGRNDSR